MDLGQFLLTTHEEGIARIGHVPDGWQGSTRSTRCQQWHVFDHPANPRNDIGEGLIRVSAILKVGAPRMREGIHNERLAKEVSHSSRTLLSIWLKS
jgi:hypothetical protein